MVASAIFIAGTRTAYPDLAGRTARLRLLGLAAKVNERMADRSNGADRFIGPRAAATNEYLPLLRPATRFYEGVRLANDDWRRGLKVKFRPKLS